MMTNVSPFSPLPVLCTGAIHYDTLAHASEAYRPETSTPAKLTAKPGGVATNIARTLVRLDIPTGLAGAIGADGAGASLSEQLTADGIELYTLERTGFSTGQYIAFHNPDGSLAAASVDDRVLSEAPPDLFDPVFDALPASLKTGLWFIDANLPDQLLKSVSDRAPEGRLVANAVSNAKATRLLPLLPKLHCLMLNRGEALAMTGKSTETSSEDLLRDLQYLGAKRVVLTNGKSDVLVLNEEAITAHKTLATQIVDVTGAGDALTAGTIAGLCRGYHLNDAVPLGLRAAAITLKSTGALAEGLSWDALATLNEI
jgi:pseudouridine kinase